MPPPRMRELRWDQVEWGAPLVLPEDPHAAAAAAVEAEVAAGRWAAALELAAPIPSERLRGALGRAVAKALGQEGAAALAAGLPERACALLDRLHRELGAYARRADRARFKRAIKAASRGLGGYELPGQMGFRRSQPGWRLRPPYHPLDEGRRMQLGAPVVRLHANGAWLWAPGERLRNLGYNDRFWAEVDCPQRPAFSSEGERAVFLDPEGAPRTVCMEGHERTPEVVGSASAASYHARTLLPEGEVCQPKVVALGGRAVLCGLCEVEAGRPEVVPVVEREVWFGLNDELWAPRWRLRLPPMPGWRRKMQFSLHLLTPAQYQAADRLGVSLPATKSKVLAQLRAASAAVDPDAPEAAAQLAELYAAFVCLRDDPAADPGGVVVDAYAPTEPEAALPALDRVVLLARGDGGALVTTSGRLLFVDPDGHPQRAYPLPATPRELACHRGHTYLRFDRALYIFGPDQALVATLPLYEPAQLLVHDAGFILLGKRSLRLFRPQGQLQAEVTSRRRIRQLLPFKAGLRVRTKRHEFCLTDPRLFPSYY